MRSHQQSNRDDIAAEIAESVQVVVHVSRFATGRRVSEIIAVRGYDRDRKVFLYDHLRFAQHTPRDPPCRHCLNSSRAGRSPQP